MESTNRAAIVYPSGAPELIPVLFFFCFFCEVRVARSLVFYVVFLICRSLFVLCPFFFGHKIV